MIAPGASPGETKMWASVRENYDFLRSWIMSKRVNICSHFFTILVYRTYTDTVTLRHEASRGLFATSDLVVN